MSNNPYSVFAVTPGNVGELSRITKAPPGYWQPGDMVVSIVDSNGYKHYHLLIPLPK